MTENEGIFHNAMIQGHSAAWDQEWDEAAALYRKAVEQMPSNPMAIASLGLALYEQKKYTEALVCYKRAAKLSPEDPLSIEKMADIYERMDNIDQAIDSSMRAADLHLKIRDAEKAIENSKLILVESKEIAMELINEYGPEHFIICTGTNDFYIDGIQNAGSVFIGNYTPESAGDYASGTNHTLPTNGYSKAYSGVNLDSFLKAITFQEISAKGIQNIGATIALMAEAEGLDGHKNAVTLRLNSL